MIPKPLRIDVPEVLRRQQEEGMLLACAYDDTDKCNKIGVPGALQLAELERRLDTLDGGRSIALYCA